jgi:hypothetical protein
VLHVSAGTRFISGQLSVGVACATPRTSSSAVMDEAPWSSRSKVTSCSMNPLLGLCVAYDVVSQRVRVRVGGGLMSHRTPVRRRLTWMKACLSVTPCACIR